MNREITPETTAAIVLLSIAVDEILEKKKVNSEILEELQYLRPQLNSFIITEQ